MTNAETSSKDGPPSSSSSYGPDFVGSGFGGGPTGSSGSDGSLSKLDIKILDLNRAGKSTRAIARAVRFRALQYNEFLTVFHRILATVLKITAEMSLKVNGSM